MNKSTTAIHPHGSHHRQYGEVSVPIYQTSTFAFENADQGAERFAGKTPGYIYSRLGNPTVNALADAIAALENGSFALATSTGMSAITTVFLAYLQQGTHVVSSACVYGPTRTVLETSFARFGNEATFVDTGDLAAVEAAMRSNTRIVYLETPANPTMQLSDIAGAAAIAHAHGALLVVDNTFASPYLQRPLDLGADIVVHSCTKLINGHSDVVGGAIVVRDEKVYRQIRPTLNLFGGTMDPHQAWLILRGFQTLPLRAERSEQNAMALARHLRTHPMVSWISYPGLEEHPQHALARRQMDGFGNMIAIGVKGGLAAGKAMMNSVKVFTLAVSLGGVESLIEHPASMTHAGLSSAEREAAGLTDDLVRIAVGCEHVDDLRADLDQALAAAGQAVECTTAGSK
ncbi:MAG TPA: aminotransferase class I/II-fold pyridoxal phosphate-dependent enzyme [Vicinamibacterales bacterium]